MAKAQFHRNQKVWVESVGAWATVERIAPIWAKGFDEPVRITYDVGLGRDFLAAELQAEDRAGEAPEGVTGWRVLRARNKWQPPEDCGHHPYPGTFPVVVTDASDWGGWRVPGAEYDRDPRKIEHQAQLLAAVPQMLSLMQRLIAFTDESGDDAPADLVTLAQDAVAVLRHAEAVPKAPHAAKVSIAS